MDAAEHPHFRLDHDGDVAIARVVTPEIRQPAAAEAFGQELDALVTRDGHRRILVDMRHAKYLCSSAFAALMGFARRAEAAGARVALCAFDPDVAVGANIIGLGRVVATYPDERSALDAL